MLLHYDLDRDVILDADRTVLGSLAFRYNADGEVRLRFLKGGARVDPAGLTEILLTVKSSGKYDQQTPLILDGAWTKTGSGDTAEWTAYPDTTSAVIADALDVDNDDTNDDASVATQADIRLVIAGRARISALVSGTIQNSNYRDDDNPPTAQPAPGTFALASQTPMFRTDITALTGGGVNAMDGLVTANGLIPLGKLLIVIIGGALQIWQLQLWDGVTAEDSGVGLVLPDDADDPDNLRIWVRVL